MPCIFCVSRVGLWFVVFVVSKKIQKIQKKKLRFFFQIVLNHIYFNLFIMSKKIKLRFAVWDLETKAEIEKSAHSYTLDLTLSVRV